MVQYVDRTFGKFDPSKPLRAARRMSLLDKELNGGELITGPKAVVKDLDEGIARRLWMTRYADYDEDYRPTPEQEVPPEDQEWMAEADGVTVEAGENGWYTLKAAWLPEEGEKVRGIEAAQQRAAEVRETGDTKGFEAFHSGGGWYTITGPGIDPEEPIKVQGEEAANEKLAELRADASASRPADEPTDTKAAAEEGGEGDSTEA